MRNAGKRIKYATQAHINEVNKMMESKAFDVQETAVYLT